MRKESLMGCVLGVDIGGTNIKLGIVSMDGEVLESGMVPTRAEEGPEVVARRVGIWLREKRANCPDIVAAGVGCAGLVDGVRGFLHYSPNLHGWDDVPLAGIFSEELSLPVVADNDVNMAAYGEYLKGAGVGTKHFICITLGTGVGGGIIVDGDLVRGSSGFAGEFGHTVIQVDGPLCSCGKRGCVEALIGADAIVRRARRLLEAGDESRLADSGQLTVKGIADAALDGDKLAIRVFEETGHLLGIGLSNLVHIFNPEVIAIGGGISGAGDLILDPARETIKGQVMNRVLADVRIVQAELGNKASLLGAALLAVSNFK
jgi:glucokinase